MEDRGSRFVSHIPASLPKAATQIDILHIHEEPIVEAGHLFESLASHHECGAAYPIDGGRWRAIWQLERREDSANAWQPPKEEVVAKDRPDRGFMPG